METNMSMRNSRTNKPPMTIPVSAPELSSGTVLLFGTALVAVVVKKFEEIGSDDSELVLLCGIDLEDLILVAIGNTCLVVDNCKLVDDIELEWYTVDIVKLAIDSKLSVDVTIVMDGSADKELCRSGRLLESSVAPLSE